MKFTKAKYEEIFQLYGQFLDLLVGSGSHIKSYALVMKNNFTEPDFKSEFWTQFSSNFKKLIQSATNYTTLSGEDEKVQLDVKRLLPIIRVLDPLEFAAEYKSFYLSDNRDDISKRILKEHMDKFMLDLPPGYRYVDDNSNDYEAHFDVVSIDGKKRIRMLAALDKKNRLRVEAEATYQDSDFEFDVDLIVFDPLQFATISGCAKHIISKIDLKASMRVSGTRIRIGSYVFLLSARELAVARAEILQGGTTKLYSVQGDHIQVTDKPIGKVVDKVAKMLLAPNSNDKLYFTIAVDEKAVKEKQEKEVAKAAAEPKQAE